MQETKERRGGIWAWGNQNIFEVHNGIVLCLLDRLDHLQGNQSMIWEAGRLSRNEGRQTILERLCSEQGRRSTKNEPGSDCFWMLCMRHSVDEVDKRQMICNVVEHFQNMLWLSKLLSLGLKLLMPRCDSWKKSWFHTKQDLPAHCPLHEVLTTARRRIPTHSPNARNSNIVRSSLQTTRQSGCSNHLTVLDHARSGRWFAALASLKGFVQQGGKVNVVSVAAATKGLAECTLWQSALQMISAENCFPVNTFVANAVLSACGRARLVERVGKIFEQMIEQGPHPDVATLNIVLGLYGEHSEKAQNLLASAHTLNIQTSLLSHNLCLTALQRSAKWLESLWLLSEGVSNSLGKDGFTQNSVLAACMRSRQWQCCIDFWESTESATSMAAGTVGSALMEGSLWSSAFQVLEELHQAFLKLDTDFYAVLGSACMARAKRDSSFQLQAWLIAHMLLDRKASTFSEMSKVFQGSFLATYSRSEQWHKSAELLIQLQREALRTDSVMYNSVGCTASWGHSQVLFQSMCCKQLEPDLASWNSLISKASWQQSCYCLEALTSKNLQMDAILLSTVVAVLGATGGPWRSSVEVMRKAAMQRDHVLSSVMLLSSKLSWERSFQLSHDLRDKLHTKASDSGLENAVLTAYQEGSGWHHGLQVLENLLKSQCEPEGQGVSAVFTACGSSGKWKAMLSTTALLSNGARLSFPFRVQPTPCWICRVNKHLRWLCKCVEQRELCGISQGHGMKREQSCSKLRMRSDHCSYSDY